LCIQVSWLAIFIAVGVCNTTWCGPSQQGALILTLLVNISPFPVSDPVTLEDESLTPLASVWHLLEAEVFQFYCAQVFSVGSSLLLLIWNVGIRLEGPSCRENLFFSAPGTDVKKVETTETLIKQYLKALFYLQEEQYSEYIGRSKYCLEIYFSGASLYTRLSCENWEDRNSWCLALAICMQFFTVTLCSLQK
uniref:Uncharacterized protein n=1 Tax=Mola mola TaxID=94237 RepID=A0A3Q3VZD0_MOLML